MRIIPNPEGYFDALRNKYYYNFTDHLGNIRLSYSDANGDGIVTGDIVVNNCVDNGVDITCNSYITPGEAEGLNNYYPFGLAHANSNFEKVYQYKYNGKELQETGMYDYGARFYMPDIGRWGVHDPLSELQFAYSPYSYVYGNPIKFTDPTGMIGEDPDPQKIYGPRGGKLIEEVVIQAPLKPIKSHDSSLSWMGINSLNAYHASEDRLAAAIRNSKAALATEKFERNLAFTMGTFMMGGSNIVASAGWSALTGGLIIKMRKRKMKQELYKQWHLLYNLSMGI
ncbi:RHS repeat-associated protein [Chryseobacterium sp. SLBN-27]|uniref:RHS repeat domain-containing protein n=1 Tax=Chryseobacterium sp. SLBN-27 TaxID=3042287 RepID=UPI002860FD75|nr:RHS repeat-associated core domain-containing protein [Chryseobacterium sp. SLBN-27]MDR6160282.1 RHS repeat-associated protein [Chryseobacterium sp. SLBN-27]